ncbi:MFS transporter [Streptomyces sp. RKAG337]|uniref:MFS transporter n=1 Tax=Streptomyces sp. RKAG337 TaxID=2893404 RepID=UPI00203471BB|nr:MFS transporter [Streptomyces sp. RKAG337]MCM2425496.1 MFS transporter [Streptomyces sp. RKAG337]
MSSPRPTASYAAVLRVPHARRTFAAALLGRLSYGIVSLSLLLSLAAATGSYAAAGMITTVFAATSVVLGPARAGLIDRWGARRALPTLATPYAVALSALCLATWRPGAPLWLLTLLSATAGTLTPPLGPTMRALWSALVPDKRLLQRAFSLDTVAEEGLFMTGPLIAVAVRPALGLALSAALVLIGTLALTASPAAKLLTAREPSAPAARLRSAGVRRAAYAAAGLGCCLGALELYVVVFADHHDRASAAGWILAAHAAGSAIGGLLYGRIAWRRPAAGRLPYLLAALALLFALTGAAPTVVLFALGIAAAGTVVSPTMATAYLAADELAPPGTATRASAWVNTGVNAGSSLGSGTAGLLVDRLPLPLCFLLAAAPPLLLALRAYPRSGRDAQGRSAVPLAEASEGRA